MTNCINYNQDTGHCNAKNHKCVFDWPNARLCEMLFGKLSEPIKRR
jgi:hypothetical protein